ncbi:hypothetical protein GCM10022224_056950 [Nonomuraea antimicrobica]|uniref:DUF1275 domain-containing protein n=1 Tax=Nonomuraea antimicrobica TaxID=561173 RepID=A0ABP7CE10_9ACTN
MALSFSTGIYEAICFLSFGKVFTAVQTGNLVFLGIAVAGTGPPAGPNPPGVVISLVAFAAGAALAIPILRASGPGVCTDEDRRLWPPRVSVALAVGLVPQIIFLAVWMTTSWSAVAIYIMIAAGAMSMGMRMNAIRSLHVLACQRQPSLPPTSPW